MTPDPPTPPPPVPAGAPAPHRRRRGPAVTAAAVLAVAVAGTLVYLGARYDPGQPTGEVTQESTRLQAAKSACAPGDLDVSLGDGGTSLVISRVAAEERPGASLAELACILDRVDIPDAVISQMDGTRALDGRQHASWDGFTASWTYHPDDGINVILQEDR
jgi:hypothetical protein